MITPVRARVATREYDSARIIRITNNIKHLCVPLSAEPATGEVLPAKTQLPSQTWTADNTRQASHQPAFSSVNCQKWSCLVIRDFAPILVILLNYLKCSWRELQTKSRNSRSLNLTMCRHFRSRYCLSPVYDCILPCMTPSWHHWSPPPSRLLQVPAVQR